MAGGVVRLLQRRGLVERERPRNSLMLWLSLPLATWSTTYSPRDTALRAHALPAHARIALRAGEMLSKRELNLIMVFM